MMLACSTPEDTNVICLQKSADCMSCVYVNKSKHEMNKQEL